MPVVLVPFVAIGVALLALLVAYALTVMFTPLLEGLARNVPVVGGYIARAIGNALDYAGRHVKVWADQGVDLVTGWLHGLAVSVREFVDAVNRYLVELPGLLDHLLTVTIPHLIGAAAAPVGNVAGDVRAKVDRLVADLSDVFTKPLREFKGIEHGVELRVDALGDAIRNVDLPDWKRVIDREVNGVADAAGAGTADVRRWAEREIGGLRDQLGRLPLDQLLTDAAAAAGVAALVDVLARETGLDRAECRAKVKNICGADPEGWAQLLGTLALGALAWGGLDELVHELQGVTAELAGAVVDLVGS